MVASVKIDLEYSIDYIAEEIRCKMQKKSPYGAKYTLFIGLMKVASNVRTPRSLPEMFA